MVTLPTRALAAAALTAAVALIVARRRRAKRVARTSPPPARSTDRTGTDDLAPMEWIRGRFERGEIDAREYQRLVDLLRGASP
jgi:hypothetical protein